MNFDQEKDKKETIKPGQYVYSTNQMHQEKERFIEENHKEAKFKTNPNYYESNQINQQPMYSSSIRTPNRGWK